MTATNDFMAPVSFGNCFLHSNTMNYICPLNVTAFTVHVKVLTHYNEMNEINEVYTTAYISIYSIAKFAQNIKQTICLIWYTWLRREYGNWSTVANIIKRDVSHRSHQSGPVPRWT